jgi:hypothetical protein
MPVPRSTEIPFKFEPKSAGAKSVIYASPLYLGFFAFLAYSEFRLSFAPLRLCVRFILIRGAL